MKAFGGPVIYLDRNDINTDEIIPAKYLTEISKTALKPHLLEDLLLNGISFNHQADEMKKAKVVGINCYKPNTCDDASKRFRDMEEVRFMFEEIKFKDEEGNEYTDKWELA